MDLAWGSRNRTGIAVLDPDGELCDLAIAVSDDDILALLAGYVSEPCVVGFDAPLVVTNPTGRRPCEAALNRVFARYDAGAHPSNLSRPHFADGGRAMRLARRLGLNPYGGSARRALEVYPHPATVALFGLERTLKYKHKPGRDLELLRGELLRLVELLESLADGDPPARPAGHPRWSEVRTAVETATRKVDLKKVEDQVDAVVCAYVCLHAVRRPAQSQTFGDPETGCIVTPAIG